MSWVLRSNGNSPFTTTSMEQLARVRGRGGLRSLPRLDRPPNTADEVATVEVNAVEYAGAVPLIGKSHYVFDGVFRCAVLTAKDTPLEQLMTALPSC
jgi:hypothetical protein